MVLLRQPSPNLSSGLLPTPSSPPYKELQPISYVAPSCYPIPFPVVVLLEGCSILDVLSWSLNVSSKSLKLKITWSCSQNSSTVNTFKDIFPTNILNSLNLHNISRPNWSSSSSSSPKPSISLSIDWQLQPCISPNNSSTSIPYGSPSESLPPSTFSTPNSKHPNNHYFDSGFGSSSRCHGSSDRNWRNTSPPPQPKFTSPARNRPRNHDVFVPEPKPTSPPPPKHSYVSPKVSQPANIISKPASVESTSEVDLRLKQQLDLSATSQTSVYLPTIPELVSPPLAPVIVSPPFISADFDSTSSTSDSEHDLDLANNIFYPSPSPLITDENGFLDDETDAHFMNIPGRCRLCSSPSASYLIDNHLLECSKLNPIHMENFLDVVSSEINIDKAALSKASKDYTAFQLSDKLIPNNIFKSLSDYRLFTGNIDLALFELADEALTYLNLKPNTDHFHILNYSAVVDKK